jgi:hypothetical protein
LRDITALLPGTRFVRIIVRRLVFQSLSLGATTTKVQRLETKAVTQREAVDVVGAAGAGVDAANAETAAMSCTDMLVTTDFISADHGPRRAPVFMSKSCRIV